MKAISHQRKEAQALALTPSSSPSQKQRSSFWKENQDPNTMPPDPNSSQFRSKPLGLKSKSPLPPRPPPMNPRGNSLKRKLNLETLTEGRSAASTSSDSGVQVVVRMRPPNKDEEENDQIVQKISPNSVSILDHTFTFDSVADAGSTQNDIFQLVGLPLVENCLAGFNSSIFAYGQTGSGKTYTMWGPPSALSAKDSLCEERGLTPRVFERLFSRIIEVILAQFISLNAI